MLAHVKLQNSVLNLRTVYKIRLKASWLPTCLFSTSVRQTLPALLLPFFLNYSSLYGSPLLAAQQYRGFKKKKKDQLVSLQRYLLWRLGDTTSETPMSVW